MDDEQKSKIVTEIKIKILKFAKQNTTKIMEKNGQFKDCHRATSRSKAIKQITINSEYSRVVPCYPRYNSCISIAERELLEGCMLMILPYKNKKYYALPLRNDFEEWFRDITGIDLAKF